MKQGCGLVQALAMACILGLGFGAPRFAAAHCDTLDGPVITTARAALEKGDVTPTLKWVQKDDEAAIREAFQKILAVPSRRRATDQCVRRATSGRPGFAPTRRGLTGRHGEA